MGNKFKTNTYQNSMNKIILLLIVMGYSFLTRADSPLTSTNFYKAYLDIPIISKASKAGGILNKEMINYLGNDSISLDLKLALINAIGWDHKNDNSKIYLRNIIKRKNYESEFPCNDYLLLKYNGTAEEQICYAYMRALDNYFDITSAFAMSEAAVRKSSSYSINMIHLLIKAQGLTSLSETCHAAKIFCELKNKQTFINDMRLAADKFVFDYIDSLGANCMNPK
jgi:hypothetical protein